MVGCRKWTGLETNGSVKGNVGEKTEGLRSVVEERS